MEKKYLSKIVKSGNTLHLKDSEARDSLLVTQAAVGIDTDSEFVDLGLPSGTLWARRNIGASAETDIGLYFEWGETTGYTAAQVGTDRSFVDGGNKWSIAAGVYSKYNASDGRTELERDDDAAFYHTNGRQVMPTVAQFKELCDNSTYTHYDNYNGSGVAGRLVKSKINGNTIFFPYGGKAVGNEIQTPGVAELYQRTLKSPTYGGSSYMADISTSADSGRHRYYGLNVRGVKASDSMRLEYLDGKALHPVDMDSITTASTFRRNSVLGINGVLYRALSDTADLPVSLVTQDGAFVVNVVEGRKAYVVGDTTLSSSWEVWTDAGLAYLQEAIEARVAALENISAESRLAALETAAEDVTYNGTTYTVRQLLETVASMMGKTYVVSE